MIINTGQRTDIPGYWVAIRHFQLQATILEIYGVDCIDEGFADDQLYWLNKWQDAFSLKDD